MNTRLVLPILLLALSSCAKQQQSLAPETGREVIARYHRDGALEIQNRVEPSRHDFDEPIDSVWAVLPGVYEQLGIETNLTDRRGYQIGNTRFVTRRIAGTRLSRYLRCGSSVGYSNLADSYRVTMSVMTRVRLGQDRRTLLQTEVTGSAVPRQVSGNTVICTTTGRLESRIAELASSLLHREPT